MGLWSTKSITQLMTESEGGGGPTLKRTLTGSNLVLLGIGAIIGAGIFVLTGSAAAQYAGPGIVISFIIAGFGCLFAGLCYAEFASMIPIAGSAYTYGYATLGEFIAWIIGWDLILEYLFAAGTVAVGWSGYFTAFLTSLGITLPASLVGAPLSVEGTHTLVRSQICVDPATGGIAVDAVSHTPVAIADCVTKGFQIGAGILNVPAILLVVALTTETLAGSDPAHDWHAHRLGQALAFGHLRHAAKASFDHAWRETAGPAGPERLGHGIRQPHDLHGAGPVRQAPHEAALLERRDQAVNAGFRFEIQSFLHLVEGGGHARLLQALMDEHEELFLLGCQHLSFSASVWGRDPVVQIMNSLSVLFVFCKQERPHIACRDME